MAYTKMSNREALSPLEPAALGRYKRPHPTVGRGVRASALSQRLYCRFSLNVIPSRRSQREPGQWRPPEVVHQAKALLEEIRAATQVRRRPPFPQGGQPGNDARRPGRPTLRAFNAWAKTDTFARNSAGNIGAGASASLCAFKASKAEWSSSSWSFVSESKLPQSVKLSFKV